MWNGRPPSQINAVKTCLPVVRHACFQLSGFQLRFQPHFFTGKMSASRQATLLARRAAVALSSRSAVPAASSTQAVRYFGKWRSLGFWHERRHLEGALSYRGNYRHADAYACTYSTLFSSRCPFLLSLWCWNILIGNDIWVAWPCWWCCSTAAFRETFDVQLASRIA